MVRTRKQLKQEKLTYQLNNSGSFPKWIDFPLNIEQLNKIKRYNSYEMLGRSQLKEQEYSKWRKQGYKFVNLQNGKFSWRKNDFSYFIEQDLFHYVLWQSHQDLMMDVGVHLFQLHHHVLPILYVLCLQSP